MRTVFLLIAIICLYHVVVQGRGCGETSSQLVLNKGTLLETSSHGYLDLDDLRLLINSNGQVQIVELDNNNHVVWAWGSTSKVCTTSNKCSLTFQKDGNLVMNYADGFSVGTSTYQQNAAHLLFQSSPPYLTIVGGSCNQLWPTTMRGPSVGPLPRGMEVENDDDIRGTSAMRYYWDQPGGDYCVWNTPLGDGAVWGDDNDPDTQDLRQGGFINSLDNYGSVCWVSQNESDPTATFTANNIMRVVGGPNGTIDFVTVSVTAHLVVGSCSPGPFPIATDQPYSFVDVTGNPGIYFTFGPVEIDSFAAGQGPYNTWAGEAQNATSDDFAEDQELGTMGTLQSAGLIRGYDIDPNQNPAMIPGTNLTAVQHMLRYATDSKFLKSNIGDPTTTTLAPDSWPQLFEDGQSGNNIYYGNLKAGTTVGIPMSTSMPDGLSKPGQQIWWTLQHYGALWRDQSGGGFHLFVDQAVPSDWINDANNDLPNIVQYLAPLRNQHQYGQDFTDFPKNGPGNRVDGGPPPLANI